MKDGILLKKENLASGVYERKKIKGIFSLEFPLDLVLQEEALSKELSVGRAPVREKVQRLAQEGGSGPTRGGPP